MDGSTIAGITALAAAVGAALTKAFDFFLARGRLQADVTVTQAKAETERERAESEIDMQERRALNLEWAEMREEMRADRDRSRAEVDALSKQLQRVSEQLAVEQQARAAAEARLLRVEAESEARIARIERELIDALGSRDHMERKLRRLEMYVELLLEKMRVHGVAPPAPAEESGRG